MVEGGCSGASVLRRVGVARRWSSVVAIGAGGTVGRAGGRCFRCACVWWWYRAPPGLRSRLLSRCRHRKILASTSEGDAQDGFPRLRAPGCGQPTSTESTPSAGSRAAAPKCAWQPHGTSYSSKRRAPKNIPHSVTVESPVRAGGVSQGPRKLPYSPTPQKRSRRCLGRADCIVTRAQ